LDASRRRVSLFDDSETGDVIDRRSAAFLAARAHRRNLLVRLRAEEGADDLADRLAKCGEEFFLDCTSCGYSHRAEKACNLKWCPVCARRKAAQKVAKYEKAVLAMQWPLALAFTITNTETIDADAVRRFRKDVRRLIRSKLFRATVKGGIYSIELVNTGRGWHLHVHMIVDAEWLSLTVAPPRRADSRDRKLAKFKAAQQELHDVWCKIVGQLLANIYTSRVAGREVLVETMKYSVKPADLIAAAGPIAPAIRALSAGRLSTPFGSLWGIKKDLRDDARPPFACPSCAEVGSMIPEELTRRFLRDARDPMKKFRGPRRAA
jgi:hypothetical protein